MVLRCAIHLEEDQNPFYYTAGGVVSGFIVLSTTWSDKVYGISVKLASKVEVDWDASRLFNPYRTSRNEDVAFHSDCQILMNRTEGEQSCLANLVSKRTIMITRGVVHRYPFLLKLPKELPCSFNGTFGHVTYKLVVFIRKPFREMYIGATKSIQVGPFLDLNEQSVHLQLPVADERKYFLSRARSASFRNSRTPTPTTMSGSATGQGQGLSQGQLPPVRGSSRSTSTSPAPSLTPLQETEVVSMRICLPKTGFVPDQLIQFEVDVDNRSHLSLTGVKVVLNANTYFQIDQSCKIDGRTLLQTQGPGVEPHGRELYTHAFTCPHVLPTGLGTGIVGAIDLQYFIQFELRISDVVQLSSVVKVVIGTVAFLQRNLAPGLASYLLEMEEGMGSEELLLLTHPSFDTPFDHEGSRSRSNSSSISRPHPQRSTSISSLPPSYDCFQLKSSRLYPEHAETPPPTYEEALSKSLSLLRAHNNHHHHHHRHTGRSTSRSKSKSKSKASSTSTPNPPVTSGDPPPPPTPTTSSNSNTTSIAEFEGDCCTCLNIPH